MENKIDGYFHNIKAKSVSMRLRKLIVKAGIGVSSNIKKKRIGIYRDAIPAVHGLRKFTITQLAKAKVDTEIAKLLTGHSIGVRAKYLNYSDEDLLKEYSLALDNLTIDPANRLKLKVAEQEQTITVKLSEKDSEIKKLQEQMTSLEGIMNDESAHSAHLQEPKDT